MTLCTHTSMHLCLYSFMSIYICISVHSYLCALTPLRTRTSVHPHLCAPAHLRTYTSTTLRTCASMHSTAKMRYSSTSPENPAVTSADASAWMCTVPLCTSQ